MLTRKEMNYINRRAFEVPYPGEDYSSQTLFKLKQCIDFYNAHFLDKKYTIQFSNNEEIDFEIASKNLAHLLGIDYKSIAGDYGYAYRKNVLDMNPSETISSYMLLQKLIDKASEILSRDSEGKSCEMINYYRVNAKCDIFSKLADISKFNYGCINFDKATFERENEGDYFSPSSTKLLYTESDEVLSPYCLMGLKIDNGSSNEKYIAETLMTLYDPRKFFVGQEVVIPTQILTDVNGELDKNIATPAEKLKLLKDYQNIVNTYGIPNNINIYGDYYSMLVSDSQNLERKLHM